MTRRGFTLIEMLLALTLLSILAAIALPALHHWRDRVRVAQATATTRAALDLARGAALRLQRPVSVTAAPGAIRAITDSAGQPRPLATWRLAPDISLAGLARPIAFGALGLAVGASNRTLTLRRGSVQRTIVLSRLGRIR